MSHDNPLLQFAILKRYRLSNGGWENNFSVEEYAPSIEWANDWISRQPKSNHYRYEIGEYS